MCSWQLAGGCSWPQLIVTKGAVPHGTPNQPPVEAGPCWVPALCMRAPVGPHLFTRRRVRPTNAPRVFPASRSSGQQGSPTTGTSWSRQAIPTASSLAFPSTCEDRSTSSPRRQVPAAPVPAWPTSSSKPAQTASASQSVDQSDHASLPNGEDEG